MSDKVVDIGEWRADREVKEDEWLDKMVAEHYSDDSEMAVKNPTLRLMTLYDVLEGEEKNEFYGYVRRVAESMLGERIRREQFWAFMTAAKAHWGDMEEYGKQLVRNGDRHFYGIGMKM